MILKDWLQMVFQARPANPPAGEVYIYPDAETGKPVWQDKDGVHGFGVENAVTGATLNGEDVPVEGGTLSLVGLEWGEGE
jgi:hypothetical protein